MISVSKIAVVTMSLKLNLTKETCTSRFRHGAAPWEETIDQNQIQKLNGFKRRIREMTLVAMSLMPESALQTLMLTQKVLGSNPSLLRV